MKDYYVVAMIKTWEEMDLEVAKIRAKNKWSAHALFLIQRAGTDGEVCDYRVLPIKGKK